ncbi:hypothetical protein SAMD00019534_046270 [Acytostelium subglobosum LB1]|uniref:hypothetical protein n=1 Tax=Acytostelium subglobosum LB1 TaxID=1410327 RepID=UPI000644A0D8|nr:hypothetical protein SAMD00019534_046270 [Acytostelium subglobosum LB1]GAM21452.1 hypothetical protein SAMD00019534_046270 [Acytostelium subglobosum LB1]|eukprot:XP_012755571.1 hypothetical protein SAMD00019534_046270 [Acytostelium subglobosum LB1]
MESSFAPNQRNDTIVLSFVDNIDRMLNLTSSQFPQLQYSGVFSLSELTFQRFKQMVVVFANYRSFTPILKLLKSKEKKTRDHVMSLLWNFSAEESLKIKLFDEGILDYLLDGLDKLGEEQTLSSSAIIQNLSEFRFERGIINPNQLKIVRNKTLMNLLINRSRSNDKKIKFLTCLTICNLSMHDEIRNIFIQEDYFKPIEEFLEAYIEDTQFPGTFNWVTLQPHVPLLDSKDILVQRFVLYCIYSFATGSRYDRSLWKSMMENKGVQSLLRHCKSKDELVRNYAVNIAQQLNIGEVQSIVVEDDEDEMRRNLMNLYQQGLFTDFIIRSPVHGDVKIHKSICLTRCPKLRDVIKIEDNNILREMSENGILIDVIKVDDEDTFECLRDVVSSLYGFLPQLTPERGRRLLHYANRLDLIELKQHCEFYLWHHLDVDNAGEYLELALSSSANQLQKVVIEYIMRNLTSIYLGNVNHLKSMASSTSTIGIRPDLCNVDNKSQWKGEWSNRSIDYIVEHYQQVSTRHKKEIFQLNKEVSELQSI